MRIQPAKITEVITGPTDLFIAAWCKPPQHNEHCIGWKYLKFMADCKLRHANVRKAAREIIARRNAQIAQNEIIQIAAE
jgi:hypothetical protein